MIRCGGLPAYRGGSASEFGRPDALVVHAWHSRWPPCRLCALQSSYVVLGPPVTSLTHRRRATITQPALGGKIDQSKFPRQGFTPAGIAVRRGLTKESIVAHHGEFIKPTEMSSAEFDLNYQRFLGRNSEEEQKATAGKSLDTSTGRVVGDRSRPGGFARGRLPKSSTQHPDRPAHSDFPGQWIC